ncbi:MAG: Zn-ribbon domain-containing OB-fold protein [Planctomycetales bacterium]|nr:Zn-ribbon domain-containing OB-fold protein [Planctomycetales bacterium]
MSQPSQTPGTALRAEDFSSGRVITVRDRLFTRYAWDAGVAIGRYLAGLRRGVILGSRCPKCDRTVVPVRSFCERCFSALVDEVPLTDRGTVNTFSVTYVTWDMKKLEKPLIPAVIEIEGASKGCGILHLLDPDLDPKTVKVGMRVRAVWKGTRSREGAITDIRHFARLEEGAGA